jgi:ribosomal protein S27AE
MPPANPTSWEDIYGGRLPESLPSVPRNMTDRVDDPQCPRDCSGRHGMDSELRCGACGVTAYVDEWHEYRVNRGVNFHRLKQMNGTPQLVSAHMPCPVCGGQFRK